MCPLTLAPPPCSVSEFLMGEVDSSILLSVPPGDPGQVSKGGLHIAWGQAGRAGECPCSLCGPWPLALSRGAVTVSCRVGLKQGPAQAGLTCLFLI